MVFLEPSKPPLIELWECAVCGQVERNNGRWLHCSFCHHEKGKWMCACGTLNQKNTIICRSCLKTQDLTLGRSCP